MPESSARNRSETRVREALVVKLEPLAGFTVAVTADRRADEQAALLTRLGATVVHGPVIRTESVTDRIALLDAARSLVEQRPDVVILTTAVGVRAWLTEADSVEMGDELLDVLSGPVVLARGRSVSGVAMAAGLDVTWTAPTGRFAELLAHLESEKFNGLKPGTRIAVQLDGSGDLTMAEMVTAVAPGLDVVPVPVYRWELPEDTQPAHRVIASVIDGTVDAVTFTSPPAVRNFVNLAEQMDALDAVKAALNDATVLAVAVGPATADCLTSLGVTSPYSPRSTRLGAMVATVAHALAPQAVELKLTGSEVRVQGRLLVVAGEKPVWLTDRERAVMAALSRRPGAVVSKGELRRQVWANGADDHAVEVTVGRLRRRLGPASDGIETVMRRGYRLAVS